jgi:hypothetical protein
MLCHLLLSAWTSNRGQRLASLSFGLRTETWSYPSEPEPDLSSNISISLRCPLIVEAWLCSCFSSF